MTTAASEQQPRPPVNGGDAPHGVNQRRNGAHRDDKEVDATPDTGQERIYRDQGDCGDRIANPQPVILCRLSTKLGARIVTVGAGMCPALSHLCGPHQSSLTGLNSSNLDYRSSRTDIEVVLASFRASTRPRGRSRPPARNHRQTWARGRGSASGPGARNPRPRAATRPSEEETDERSRHHMYQRRQPPIAAADPETHATLVAIITGLANMWDFRRRRHDWEKARNGVPRPSTGHSADLVRERHRDQSGLQRRNHTGGPA